MTCVLCQSSQTQELSDCENYFVCNVCDLRFLNPCLRLSPDAEKKHYENHNNDVEDPRYKEFVRPLFNEIIKRTKAGSFGLDYGAGPGPVLANMCQAAERGVDLLDPFFASTVDIVQNKYDFVYASESVEHFYYPHKEFANIKHSLKTNGFFALMTHLYSSSIIFKDWYYKRDPTHVGFYSEQTMRWICDEFAFKNVEVVSQRVVVFTTV